MATIAEKAQGYTGIKEINDDLGQKWYGYNEYEKVPQGVRFNVRNLDNGMVQYELKGEDGRVNTFVGTEDNRCIYDSKFSSSGIPAVFKDKGFKTFNPAAYDETLLSNDAFKKAQGYVRHFEELVKEGMGIYICSNCEGSGKTHLISVIANCLMSKYKTSVKFVRAVNFFAEMKRNIGADKADPYVRSNVFESALQSNILIIDDIGAGMQSGYISDLLYELISKRVQQNKVTMFTSRKQPEQLPYDNSTLLIIQEKCIKLVLPNKNIGKDRVKENSKKYDSLLMS